MHHPDCPTDQQLSAFHLGDLPDAALDTIAQHVDGCTFCEMTLRQLETDADHVLAALRCSPLHPANGTTGETLMPEENKLGKAALLAAEICPPGYELLSLLGEGGMGIVYQARHLRLNRLVAIKMLQRQTPAALARFRIEAESVARLQHPNIIQIFEVGEHQGRAFLVLEFVDGGSLAQRIAAAPQPARASAVLVQALAHAVHEAHSKGIIHRDLKPANVLLTSTGVAKISDFGLAKQMGGDGPQTQSGDLLGTPSYMAPEQAGGQTRDLGPAADVYALGAILYELLTGRPPFKANTHLDTLFLVMHAEAPSVMHLQPQAPRDLSVIVMKCLEKTPAKRYASAQALADDLGRFLEGRPIQARAVGRLERARRWAVRNPVVAGLMTGLFVVLLAGIAGISWKWHEAEVRRKEAVDERGNVVKAQQETIKERNDAQELSAGMQLDKGIELAERGDVSAGLHWMLEAARTAPDGAKELRRAALLNVKAWLGQTPALRQLVPLPHGTSTLALHPDGKRLVAGGENKGQVGFIQWFDNTSLAPVGPAYKMSSPMGGLIISTDGRRLLSSEYKGGTKQVTQCWDIESGQVLSGPWTGPIAMPVYSADGASVVVAEPGCVRLRDPGTGKVIRELPIEGNVTRLALSPDGARLVIAMGTLKTTQPGTARIWDLKEAKPVGETLRHDGAIHAVAFSPDGRLIVTGSWDRTAQRWDAATGKPIGAPLFHAAGIDDVIFSPDGRTIITHDQVTALCCWESATGQRLAGQVPRLSGVAPAHSVDGKYLLTAADFGQSRFFSRQATHAEIWQAARGVYGQIPVGDVLLKDRRQNANRAREETYFSPDGGTVLLTNTAGWIRLIDVASGAPRCPPRHYPGKIEAAAFSRDGRRLALASNDPTTVACLCEVLDSATGQPVCPPLPQNNWVRTLAFSPDGKTLYSGSFDRHVRFWDPAAGRETSPPLRQPSLVLLFELSPDGRTLAVNHSYEGFGKHGLLLWDLATRSPRGPALPGEPGVFYRFSPDSKTLVSIQPGDEAFRLYDSATAAPTGVALKSERGRYPQARFTADSATLATGSTDGAIRLWDVVTGRQLGKSMLHGSSVRDLVFSPDAAEKYLVAAYREGSIRLWDRTTYKPIGPFLWHHSSITACAFTADGRSLLTASEDGALRVWPVPSLEGEGDNRAQLERLRLRLEIRTGWTLRLGTVERLDPDEWQERRKRLVDLEGSAESAYTGFRDDQAWHDLQAQDAERDDDFFAALWHVDRLRTLDQATPGDGKLLVRRVGLLAAAGRFREAEDDYHLVAKKNLLAASNDARAHALAAAESSNRWPTALWYLDRMLKEDPADWKAYARRAAVYGKLQREKDRLADVAHAIKYGADAAFLLAEGREDARRQRWSLAAERYAHAAKLGPLAPQGSHEMALVQLQHGDLAGYRRLCKELIDRHGSSAAPAVANTVAWICVLGPDALDDFAPAVAIAESAVKQTGRNPAILNTLGAVLYRAGRHRDAIARLHEGMGKGEGTFDDWIFLALAHHKLGEADDAKKWWQRVENGKPAPESHSWNSVEARLLIREAEMLLGPR